MGDESEPKYSEVQLQALLQDGVARETAALTQAHEELTTQIATLEGEKTQLSTEKAELEAKIEVLEGEKAGAIKEFEDYKAAEERKREVAELTESRVSAIKAAAGKLFDDEYYTPEKAAKWAEMSEETFALVVDGITEAAKKAGTTTDTTTEQARQTAAFTGGESPKTPETGAGSLRDYLAAGRRPLNV